MATVFKMESGSLKTNIKLKRSVVPSDADMHRFIGQPKFASAIKYAIKVADDNCCSKNRIRFKWLNVRLFLIYSVLSTFQSVASSVDATRSVLVRVY